MRRVVLQMGVTLDGYVAGTGGEGDWGLPPEHPDVHAWKVASLDRVGTHIMGRVTYEEMAAYWPNATGDYADFMNRLPKVVFSASLPDAGWAGTRIATLFSPARAIRPTLQVAAKGSTVTITVGKFTARSGSTGATGPTGATVPGLTTP